MVMSLVTLHGWVAECTMQAVFLSYLIGICALLSHCFISVFPVPPWICSLSDVTVVLYVLHFVEYPRACPRSLARSSECYSSHGASSILHISTYGISLCVLINNHGTEIARRRQWKTKGILAPRGIVKSIWTLAVVVRVSRDG